MSVKSVKIRSEIEEKYDRWERLLKKDGDGFCRLSCKNMSRTAAGRKK